MAKRATAKSAGTRKAASKKAGKKTGKTSGRKAAKASYPGMMGDGTEEQNLNQRGNPKARIGKKEVMAAFGKKKRR